MIRAIILDCFGVFYPDPVFACMRNPETPTEKAEALHALDKQAALGALSKDRFVAEASVLLGLPAAEVEQQFFQSTNRNQALISFAQRARQKYRIALLSNIGADMMDGFFTPEERNALFDVAILSGEVRLAKPDPKIFDLVLSELDVAPAEAVFIDDSENHIRGAEKLGIRAIQFFSNQQLRRELLAIGLNKDLIDIL